MLSIKSNWNVTSTRVNWVLCNCNSHSNQTTTRTGRRSALNIYIFCIFSIHKIKHWLFFLQIRAVVMKLIFIFSPDCGQCNKRDGFLKCVTCLLRVFSETVGSNQRCTFLRQNDFPYYTKGWMLAHSLTQFELLSEQHKCFCTLSRNARKPGHTHKHTHRKDRDGL